MARSRVPTRPGMETVLEISFMKMAHVCIQGLLVGNAVTVARERRLLQTGAEERRQEERRRWGCAASIELIEPFKVCVQ